MKTSERQLDSGATILEVEGTLVLGRECEQLERLVGKMVQEGKKKIILDLSKVSYVDSFGIGILVGAFGRCKEGGGVMRVAGVQDKILHIIKIARVDLVLPLDASVEEAEQKLGAA
jgi:anti-sigma B factor antagonist